MPASRSSSQFSGKPSPHSLRRPAQVVTFGFLAAILIGTLLLLLPISATGRRAGFMEALFTATSATCVTGLIVVDTERFWTPFGQAVILILIQIGGFGVMTVAALLGLVLSRRQALRSRLVAAKSTASPSLGDVRAVMLGALRITIVVEVSVALWLVTLLRVGYDESFDRAVWSGLFHSVSAFNNAGFSTYSDSLERFVADPLFCVPVCAAVIVGGLGYPVLRELWSAATAPRGDRARQWSRWTTHTRITLAATAVLITVGTLVVLIDEWGNPATLGGLSEGGKLTASFTQGVMPRTAGFNSVPTDQLDAGTSFFTTMLMFIGGGTAGTAGGIKVGTFAVLAFVVWAELRGDADVNVGQGRLEQATQRTASTVVLVGIAAVVVPTFLIASTSPFGLENVLFEVTSAFSTTGLSRGITADLANWHQGLLIVLMFIGRLGPITLGTSLALRKRQRLFQHPVGRLLIG